MKIHLSQFAGFCDGVRRAYEMISALDIAQAKKPIYILGSLAHNADVVREIHKKGIFKIDLEDFLQSKKGEIGTIIVTAHGVGPEIFDIAKEKDIEINKVVGAMINQNLDIKFSEPAGLIKYLLEIKNKAFVSADEVVASIDVVIHENQQAVLDYQSGKEQILGFLIGQVQRKLKGKGEASLVSEKIKEKLKS